MERVSDGRCHNLDRAFGRGLRRGSRRPVRCRRVCDPGQRRVRLAQAAAPHRAWPLFSRCRASARTPPVRRSLRRAGSRCDPAARTAAEQRGSGACRRFMYASASSSSSSASSSKAAPPIGGAGRRLVDGLAARDLAFGRFTDGPVFGILLPRWGAWVATSASGVRAGRSDGAGDVPAY